MTTLLDEGGYITYADHFVPPEVPWEYFKYYRRKLDTIVEKKASRR